MARKKRILVEKGVEAVLASVREDLPKMANKWSRNTIAGFEQNWRAWGEFIRPGLIDVLSRLPPKTNDPMVNVDNRVKPVVRFMVLSAMVYREKELKRAKEVAVPVVTP